MDTSFKATQSDPALPGGLKAVCQVAGCGGFSPANGVFFWRAIAELLDGCFFWIFHDFSMDVEVSLYVDTCLTLW